MELITGKWKPPFWLWLFVLTISVVSAMASEPDAVLILDVSRGKVTCVVEASSVPVIRPERPPRPLPDCSDLNRPTLFFVQGHRNELRVFNRKFLSDYTISIDQITTLTGNGIRNLQEAENLTLSAPSFAAPPPSKGVVQVIGQRSAGDILALLEDETLATKPLADLNADFTELNREGRQIERDIRAFDENYGITYGNRQAVIDCAKITGSPDALSLFACFRQELDRETTQRPWTIRPYTEEQEFRNVLVRVTDLMLVIKNFSNVITTTAIPQLAEQLDAEVAQYEKNVITFQQDLESAKDAAQLLGELVSTEAEYNGQRTNLRTNLRLAQIRASLTKSLKPPLDDAEIGQLVKKYIRLLEGDGKRLALRHASELDTFARDSGPNCAARSGSMFCRGTTLGDPSNFRSEANRAKLQADVELPQALDDVNAQQGRLLARVNELYDYSAVPNALSRQIDLSSHPGNLAVGFTIHEVENFVRFQAAQVQNPPILGGGSAQGTSLPAPGANTTTTNSASTSNPSAAANSQTSTNRNPVSSFGDVVGTLYVHDFYKANVVAAFAYSWARDQNIVKQAAPTACGGSTGAPDNNCFSPLLNNSSSQLNLILGVDYYFRPRDTFYDVRRPAFYEAPKRSNREWLLQSTGIMGGLSATKANNWFLGLFFEPVLGVQVGAGANFTAETRLQRNYQFGAPVDLAGDFPTQDSRLTKPFISAGLDLGLFRKIFGKVTGIGTLTGTSQGK
jgi:hypothetical protein